MLYIISPMAKTKGELSLDELAFDSFNCLGKIDYSLDEATIDNLLGDKAYCGGELPESVFDIIENDQEEKGFGKYFWEDEPSADLFGKELERLGIGFEKLTEKKKDWNDSWRKQFKTINVSSSMRVVPSWEKPMNSDSIDEIYIYPGMGFGTGNHETTFLCLKLYEAARERLSVKTVLDFGCGSGILGIAAIKKDKASVDFVDIDADALDNCLQNLEHNNYESYCTSHSLVLRERFECLKEYDVVFANILENVLEMEKAALTSLTRSGGLLIVSGLLKGQERNIEAIYKGFVVLETLFKGDWVAMLLIKKEDDSSL
jgi:ribosomal protein L11 methyltransferase